MGFQNEKNPYLQHITMEIAENVRMNRKGLQEELKSEGKEKAVDIFRMNLYGYSTFIGYILAKMFDASRLEFLVCILLLTKWERMVQFLEIM